MKIRVFLSLILILTSLCIQAQIPPVSPEQARQELDRRGVDEDQLRKKMMEKGFDLDNLNPAQATEIEAALEASIQEIEAENQKATQDATNELLEEGAEKAIDNKADEVAKESAENIQKAVEEGKAVDQAIAEELVDQTQEQLPPAKIYGQEIFRDKRISVFSRSEDIAPSDTYIIGPGDKVNISIFGISQEDATYTVNGAGFIQPSRMPRINLKGMTFQKARRVIESRFAQYYRFRPEEFEVTLTFARNITVNIYGEVFNPGGYNIPATNTAFNALVAAGGPSDIGSVRNIRLIRADEVKQIDVYEFMNNPVVREEFYLQNNDIIHVSTADKVVEIKGAVKRPFRYELLPDENLKELISFAGGFTANAYKGNIQVLRIEGDLQKIIDVDYSELGTQDFPIEPGDVVTISNIATPYKNFVEINGAVEFDEKYELTSGMKITDLIDKGILTEKARTDIAFLIRTKPDGSVAYERIDINALEETPSLVANRTLEPKDRLLILTQASFVDRGEIDIQGAVRNPSTYALTNNDQIRVNDAVLLAGGLRPDATDFAYIIRTDSNTPEKKEYIRININEAVANQASENNINLQKSDVLRIFSTSTYNDEFSIRVSGAVRDPGEFKWDESLQLKDVLTLAGGLRLEAASSRIDISRVVISDDEPTKTIIASVEVDGNMNFVEGSSFELQPFDQINVRFVPEFELQQNVVLRGEVKYPGIYALTNPNETLSSVIARAGGLTSEAFADGATLFREEGNTGFIILELEEALIKKNSAFDYVLKQGDVLEIPKKKDLVAINIAQTKAAELYPDKLIRAGKFNVAHEPGKNAKYYIKEYAAGIGEKGRGRLVSVEYPNGQVKKAKDFGLFRIYPKVKKGSVVSIGRKKDKPERVNKEGEKEDIDWGKVLASAVTQATTILTLVLLVQQINR